MLTSCFRSSSRVARAPAAAAAALALGSVFATTPAAARPVLVELFTSQGCSSCPPADAVLRDLGARDDVLPLAFHVDYWDYLGWKDPFAAPQFTARQQSYARARGFNMYTPQAVIDGRSALVGSSRSGVESGVAAAKSGARTVALDFTRTGDTIHASLGTVTPEASGRASDSAREANGRIYLVSFDPQQTTAIQAGENAGRSIVYSNVVRSLRVIGQWRNAALKLEEKLLPNERGERLALIVQNDDGEVWAVASTPAPLRAARAD